MCTLLFSSQRAAHSTDQCVGTQRGARSEHGGEQWARRKEGRGTSARTMRAASRAEARRSRPLVWAASFTRSSGAVSVLAATPALPPASTVCHTCKRVEPGLTPPALRARICAWMSLVSCAVWTHREARRRGRERSRKVASRVDAAQRAPPRRDRLRARTIQSLLKQGSTRGGLEGDRPADLPAAYSGKCRGTRPTRPRRRSFGRRKTGAFERLRACTELLAVAERQPSRGRISCRYRRGRWTRTQYGAAPRRTAS